MGWRGWDGEVGWRSAGARRDSTGRVGEAEVASRGWRGGMAKRVARRVARRGGTAGWQGGMARHNVLAMC